MGYLSLRLRISVCHRICSFCSVLNDDNCSNLRQTSCPVARAQIQTSCNFEENIFTDNSLLGYLHRRCNNVLCEPICNFLDWQNIGIILCLITSILSYTKIFITLRKNQIQPLEHDSKTQSTQPTSMNMAQYRKALSSALWIQVTLVVCYLPYVVAVVLTPKRELPLPYYLARQFGVTVIYLNSTLNPFLYCWKIKEVRQAVKDTLRQVSCSSV